ncbi:MAG TPA: glycosyltransferase family 9 protein [Alphaproteobacteria bacterium]|nr:glycosyltransferase family 9 protein [Alphaproteobacteria bacterium]
MKILVISFAGIGDTIFATPLIHELRENFPAATIDAFVRWNGAKSLLEKNPCLNTVYQKDIAEDSKIYAMQFLMKLRRAHYDVSINTFPQSRGEYRFVARFIGARTRISHEYENFTAFDRMLTPKTVPVDYSKHAVENNLSLLQFLDAKPKLSSHRYELFLTGKENTWAAAYVAQQNLQGRRLFGIHVGSGATKNLARRRWPLDNYIELTRQLREQRPDLAVLFFGGPGEQEDHEKIRAALGEGKVFFPRTATFLHAAALIGRCDAFLSVDTSNMHLAAAMGVKKQIVIETPTWNKQIEPFGNSFTLVKNPAVAGRNLEFYRYDGGDIKGTEEELTRIMASVKVEDVLKAVTGQ